MTRHKTKRLILRGWKPSDYAPLARINADPDVMRYFYAPLSKAESDANADAINALIEERGWGFWAVEIPGVAPFIGFVGLHVPIVKLPFSPCVEVGWRLDKQFWGHGYATEAARFALNYGFTELDLDEIVAFTAIENSPSQAVMKRLGMAYNSETFEHPSVPRNSSLRKHVLYRMTREDWRAKQYG
ncbi:GNAT family N-acetyltransferase [Desulfovibrio sp. JC022]|uniref:GNAT family N-acetyltransferase n=1 Tax=Desulfovibrio sp. JC022 TaxID=2593642 RepID=UPI0013CFF051|nr:GNAT family N-acetyltransferase [Desulfovibrio sp. JC022]NDV23603.1 GNAT family N-acetyltransferase [Desulfovibrio sp. JC022]